MARQPNKMGALSLAAFNNVSAKRKIIESLFIRLSQMANDALLDSFHTLAQWRIQYLAHHPLAILVLTRARQ